MQRTITSLLLASLLSTNIWAQQEETTDTVQPWFDFYAERAAQYEISVEGSPDLQLKLRDKPLLTYTNPVRGRDQHGALFVWTNDGRPQLIASLWSIAHLNDAETRRTAHEVHSLTDSPVSVACPPVDNPAATRAKPLEATLEPMPKTDPFAIEWARSPAPSATLRMVQMRRIANDLGAVSIDRSDGSERPLRLMSSPLLRYQSKQAGVIDGCLFAYVLATDPEIVIAIEATAKPDSAGETQWRVIPVRITGTGLRLRHGEDELWQAEAIDYRNQAGPYRLQLGITDLPATQ